MATDKETENLSGIFIKQILLLSILKYIIRLEYCASDSINYELRQRFRPGVSNTRYGLDLCI